MKTAAVTCLLIGLAFATGGFGQVLEPYRIHNYPAKETAGFFQNWYSAQNSQGIMFFGNGGRGTVMEFDGHYWRHYPMVHPGGVYSLDVDSSGTIWVGAYGEFGYLKPDDRGELKWRNLAADLPDSTGPFTSVWKTFVLGHRVLFNAFTDLFVFENGRFRIFHPRNQFHIAQRFENSVWIRDIGWGLFEYASDADSLRFIPGTEFFADKKVDAILPKTDGTLILVTRGDGLFLFDRRAAKVTRFSTDADPILQSRTYYSGARLHNGWYALGTLDDGLYVVDEHGHLRHHISTNEGLQSPVIRHVFVDTHGLVWLALEGGISTVDFSPPVTVAKTGTAFPGKMLGLARWQGRLYISTTQGLVFLKDGPGPLQYEHVPGITTQTLDLLVSGGDLLVSENKIYVLSSSNRMEAISQDDRALSLGPIRQARPSAAVGLASGLLIVTKENGSWQKWQIFESLRDNIWSIVQDSTVSDDSLRLWGGYRLGGVVRITIDPLTRGHHVEEFGSAHGLPEGYAYVFDLDGRPVIGTEKGLYRPLTTTPLRFGPDSSLGLMFVDTSRSVYRLVQDHHGDVWVNWQGSIMRAKRVGNMYAIDSSFARLVEDIDQVERIMLDTGGVVWFAGFDGLARFDPTRSGRMTLPYAARIQMVTSSGDSVIFGGFPTSDTNAVPELPYSLNSLTFQFAAPFFDEPNRVEFSWKMEGYDETWTPWKSEHKANYTNLNEGSYRFRVLARNRYNLAGAEAAFRFDIQPPWHRTWWFFGLCLVSLAGALYPVYQYRVNRLLAVERLRVRIASDLHDDIGSTLTKVSIFSEMVQSEDDPKERQRLLSDIGTMSRTVIRTMSDIVWSIDARNDDLDHLFIRMTDFAQSILEPLGIRVQWHREGISPDRKLPLEVRQNVYLILKECVNNIAKYAGATDVSVNFVRIGRRLTLTIRDNGRGIPPERLERGHGLRNMRERAHRIGGTLAIRSEKGTTIELNIPRLPGS